MPILKALDNDSSENSDEMIDLTDLQLKIDNKSSEIEEINQNITSLEEMKSLMMNENKKLGNRKDALPQRNVL